MAKGMDGENQNFRSNLWNVRRVSSFWQENTGSACRSVTRTLLYLRGNMGSTTIT